MHTRSEKSTKVIFPIKTALNLISLSSADVSSKKSFFSTIYLNVHYFWGYKTSDGGNFDVESGKSLFIAFPLLISISLLFTTLSLQLFISSASYPLFFIFAKRIFSLHIFRRIWNVFTSSDCSCLQLQNLFCNEALNFVCFKNSHTLNYTAFVNERSWVAQQKKGKKQENSFNFVWKWWTIKKNLKSLTMLNY